MRNQMFAFLVHHGKLKPFPWKVSMVAKQIGVNSKYVHQIN